MNIRNKLNLGLIVLIAALGYIAIIQPGVENVPSLSLATLEPDNATVHIVSNGVEYGCTPDNKSAFIIKNGIQKYHKAEKSRCTELNNFLTAPLAPVSASNFQGFQFEQAGVQIKIGEKNVIPGMRHPVNRKRYIQFNNTIWLIDDRALSFITAAPTDLLSRQLLPENFVIHTIATPAYTLTSDGHKWTSSNRIHPDPVITGTKWQNLRARSISIADALPLGGELIRIKGESRTINWVMTSANKDEFTLQEENSFLIFHIINDDLIPPSMHRHPEQKRNRPDA